MAMKGLTLKSKPLAEVRADVPVDKVTASMDSDEVVRVNLPVRRTVRDKWHDEAWQRKISLAELIRRAVDEYVERHKPE